MYADFCLAFVPKPMTFAKAQQTAAQAPCWCRNMQPDNTGLTSATAQPQPKLASRSTSSGASAPLPRAQSALQHFHRPDFDRIDRHHRYPQQQQQHSQQQAHVDAASATPNIVPTQQQLRQLQLSGSTGAHQEPGFQRRHAREMQHTSWRAASNADRDRNSWPVHQGQAQAEFEDHAHLPAARARAPSLERMAPLPQWVPNDGRGRQQGPGLARQASRSQPAPSGAQHPDLANARRSGMRSQRVLSQPSQAIPRPPAQSLQTPPRTPDSDLLGDTASNEHFDISAHVARASASTRGGSSWDSSSHAGSGARSGAAGTPSTGTEPAAPGTTAAALQAGEGAQRGQEGASRQLCRDLGNTRTVPALPLRAFVLRAACFGHCRGRVLEQVACHAV